MTTDLIGSRPRIYAGWRAVAALTLVEAILFGVALYGFVIIAPPMAEQHHWSKGEMGALVSGMWLAAPISLFAAPFILRVGPWRIIAASAAIVAISMAMLGLVTEFWQLYALRAAMGLGKILAVTAMPLVISQWFSRRFATAMAVIWAGGSAGGIVMAPLTEHLAAVSGWRTAAIILGLIMAAAVPAALLIRGRRCEAGGQDPRRESEMSADQNALESKGEAMRWQQLLAGGTAAILPAILLAVVATGMAAISMIAMMSAIALEAGLSHVAGATLLAVLTAATMTGSMVIGWLIDNLRSPVAPILVIGLAVLLGICGLSGLVATGEIIFGLLGAIGAGFATGSIDIFWMATLRKRFGIGAYGLLYGFWYFALQVGYVLGGGVGGAIVDTQGAIVFIWFAGALYLPSLGLGFLLLHRARARRG